MTSKIYDLDEKFDSSCAAKLIKNSDGTFSSDDIRFLRDYVKRGLGNKKNSVTVTYSLDKRGGRFKAHVKGRFGKGMTCYTYMRREFRAILSHTVYHDIDMRNSSPSFAYQLFTNNGLDSPQLLKYIENRNEYLDLVCEKGKVSKDTAKNLFLRLSFHGSGVNGARTTK